MEPAPAHLLAVFIYLGCAFAKARASAWRLMAVKQEASTLCLGCVAALSGYLDRGTKGWSEQESIELKPLLVQATILACIVIFAKIGSLDIVLSRERMCRLRRQSLRNFFAGWLFTASIDAGGWLIKSVPLFRGTPILLFILILEVYLLRNAALYGSACHYLLLPMMRHSSFWPEADDRFVPWRFTVMIQCLRVAGGTCETARDTRSVMLLYTFVLHSYAAFRTGAGWPHSILVLTLAHLLNFNVRRGRDVKQCWGPIKFLRLSEVRRRRKASREFLLQRRQDMDPALYGSPTYAQHVVAVSHAWLSATNADPHGYHLDLIIKRLEERLCPYSDFPRAAWWWYYYFEAEADVLFFVDMSSLHQHPRTRKEDQDFKKALGLMSFLYTHLEVLAIPEIPPEVTYAGRAIPFMDKGWCWAEVTRARLGHNLSRLSPGVEAMLNMEKTHCQMSLSDGLWGYPKYPPELLEPGRLHDLLLYRDSQELRGKVFTTGKQDFELVSQQLSYFETCNLLKAAIVFGNADQVSSLLDGAEQANARGKAMANAIFDNWITSPLHLAVEYGFADVVKVLLEHRACPGRNFSGDLPWEQYGLPRFSAAARACSVWLQGLEGAETLRDMSSSGEGQSALSLLTVSTFTGSETLAARHWQRE